MDLTRSIHLDRTQPANEAVAASALRRAVIEQAKGTLMGRAGLTAAKAFAQISSCSQRTNRKVVVIAQKIIDRAATLNAHTDQHQACTRAALQDLFQAL